MADQLQCPLNLLLFKRTGHAYIFILYLLINHPKDNGHCSLNYVTKYFVEGFIIIIVYFVETIGFREGSVGD